jgi:hypothetical protein
MQKKFFEIVEKHLQEVKHEQCKLTDDDMTEMVKNYQLSYTELGTCYSYLHQILPSNDNLNKLKVSKASIENARQLWMEKLDISCTPKAHALFDGHAYDQHKRLGGIGDKLEDFLEKGDKICMMTTRLACNRAIESSYWRMDSDSDVGLLTSYVLYRLPVELEFMDLDTFPR